MKKSYIVTAELDDPQWFETLSEALLDAKERAAATEAVAFDVWELHTEMLGSIKVKTTKAK
jgi:hypothetical protein